MTLAQYLAAGETPSEDQEHELKAVDMRDFGFRGVGEMMDLVCAVRSLYLLFDDILQAHADSTLSAL